MYKKEIDKIANDIECARKFFDEKFWCVFKEKYGFFDDEVKSIYRKHYTDTTFGRIEMWTIYKKFLMETIIE